MTPLLDKVAAAEFLGVSTRQVNRYMAAGVLPYSRPSYQVVRFRQADLERFVERHLLPRPEWKAGR